MIHAALIGAGARGMHSLGSYALKRPNQLKFIAVAEPDPEKRKKFAELHQIPEERQYASWEELLDNKKLCDAMFICTSDDLHFEPAMLALEQGYHVLLEKPMSPDPKETLQMVEQAEKHEKLLLIGHVLRYTPYFTALKKIIDDGRIGKIMNVQWTEHVGYWHQAHSYVRGNWRNSDLTSPMILAKSCHDMDLLQWLINDECEQVSSFGDLSYFKEENAPEGSTDRCIDGCAVEDSCPYSALKWYYNELDKWPQYMASMEPTLEARRKALEEGPYGRCVYRCDNNVVDHQVVNMKFRKGVTVSFTMTAFSADSTRTFNIKGTKGEIFGHFLNNEIVIRTFPGRKEIIHPEVIESGHGGGDHSLVKRFLHLIEEGQVTGDDLAHASAHSHMIAFAAEHSRVTGKTVSLHEYTQALK